MLSVFNAPVDAAYHVVAVLSANLVPLVGSVAPVVATVVVTVAVRLALLPLSYRAMRGQAARARLAPRIRALQARHAGQPDKLRREVAALRAREGTGTFTGCLPVLLQWPLLSVLYLVFRSRVIAGARGALLAHRLLGVALGASWVGTGAFRVHGAVFLVLVALLAAVGWLSARLTRRLTAPCPPSVPCPRSVPRPHAVRGAAQTESTPAWLTRLLPLTTAAIAPFLPLAADVYLLTSAAWTLVERSCLRRILPHGDPPPGTPPGHGRLRMSARTRS